MAGTMFPFDYVSDNTQTYRLRLDASNGAAAGNVVATARNADCPKGLHPRYILAAHPVSGKERRIVITNPANPLYVGTTNVITLPDFGALMAPTAFNVMGRIGERRFA